MGVWVEGVNEGRGAGELLRVGARFGEDPGR